MHVHGNRHTQERLSSDRKERGLLQRTYLAVVTAPWSCKQPHMCIHGLAPCSCNP